MKCNGLSRIKLNKLFTLDDNIRELEAILGNLLNLGVHGTAVSIFFSNNHPVIIRWNQLDQRAVGASSISAFKGCLNKIRETRMGFFMD